MKKIVGTILAASLAFGAFAADPAANFVMSDFSGNAGFGWKADFADSENVKMGMFNEAAANLKFGFVKGGDKVTSGDGVWGELKIKAGDADATAIPAASVDTAKIHLVNGDFSAALNILKPTIKYGGVGVSVAAPVKASYTAKAGDDTNAAKRKTLTDNVKAAKDALTAAQKTFDGDPSKENALALANAKVILSETETALKAVPAAPAGASYKFGTAGIGDETGLEKGAGFGIEMKLENMFALNFKLMDNGVSLVKDENKVMGMAVDAALLFHEPLTFKVAFSSNFKTGYFGLQLNTGYELGITDKLYVKPVFGYEMAKANKDAKEVSNALVAGALFGWGAKDAENELDFFGKVKFNEGVSFAITPVLGLKDQTLMLMSFSLYDQSLFNLLGISDFGTLKTGFAYDLVMWNYTATPNMSDTTNTITFATAYDKDFGKAYVNLHAGVQAAAFGATKVADTTTETKAKPEFKFGVKVGTKALIDNTDLYVGYELDSVAEAKVAKKSELVIGSKISF